MNASLRSDPTLELVWETQVQRARFIPLAVIVTVGVIAGCGSSSKSSSSAASSQTANTTAQSSSTAAATSSTPSATPVALITTKHDKLGTILAYGSNKLTVYLFEGDKGKTSSCTGACAAAWPPVTGKPQAGGAAMTSNLGTITRADGTTQVTYKGHPLYLFVKDKDDGDAYGEGVKAFGADWYVLAPSGNKVDKS
jgi:predicted lipoprotein with Yx(FWY)xxD motif